MLDLDLLRRSTRLPNSERIWIGILAASFAATLIGCWWILSVSTVRVNFLTEAVAALGDETRVVTFGSSHVHYDIDPSLMAIPLMNLSTDACDYRCMEGVFAAHADQVPSLEAVVIELDIVPIRYDTLTVYHGDFRRLLDLDPDISQMKIDLAGRYELLYQKLISYSPYSGPLVSYEKLTPARIKELAKTGLRGSSDSVHPGYRSFDEVMTPERAGPERIQVHRRDTKDSDETTIEANIGALVRLVRASHERGALVVLLRFPHHMSYLENRPPEWEELLDRALERAKEAIPRDDLLYLDMERDPPIDDSEFYDGDHLNRRGAIHFTAALSERLERALRDRKR